MQGTEGQICLYLPHTMHRRPLTHWKQCGCTIWVAEATQGCKPPAYHGALTCSRRSSAFLREVGAEPTTQTYTHSRDSHKSQDLCGKLSWPGRVEKRFSWSFPQPGLWTFTHSSAAQAAGWAWMQPLIPVITYITGYIFQRTAKTLILKRDLKKLLMFPEKLAKHSSSEQLLICYLTLSTRILPALLIKFIPRKQDFCFLGIHLFCCLFSQKKP